LAGGGIRMSGGSLLMENTTIRNVNTRIHGAGLGLIGVSSATIRDCVVRNCVAQFPDVLNESN
jgi:hypothetical protein